LLEKVSDEDYVKVNTKFYNASFASHIRHSVNHFQTLITAHDQAIFGNNNLVNQVEINEINESTDAKCFSAVNYDNRDRNSPMETSKSAAVDSIDSIIDRIPKLILSTKVKMAFMSDKSKDFELYSVDSSVERELSFVAHHAIHHLAMAKLILLDLHYSFEVEGEAIGIAPSTAKHLLSSDVEDSGI
jgi:hypothetical protein